MKFISFFPFMWRNLMRKKARSISTILSMILPIFLLLIMVSGLRALDRNPMGEKGLYRLVVHHKVSLINVMPEVFGQRIKTLEGVTDIVAMNWFGGQYIDRNSENMFVRFSVDPTDLLKVFDEFTVVEGSKDDWIKEKRGALVGQKLMEKYKWKLGDIVPLKGDIYPGNYEFVIKAVYTGPSDTAMFMHRAYVEETALSSKGKVMSYRVKTRDIETVNHLPLVIDNMFENTPYPTKTESEKEFINGFVSMLGNVRLLITSIGSIIFVVILLITSNSISMSIRERVMEITILRIIGFSKKNISILLLGESILLSFMGGGIATILFIIILPLVRSALITAPMGGLLSAMEIDFVMILFGIFLSIFIGLISCLIPILILMHRKVVDNLRVVF
jgi:putative ABC transport system permease protein